MLRGMQHVAGVDVYLFVAFNVLLNLLMSCTGGGVRVYDQQGKRRRVHFRTLDWELDPVREVVAHFVFVRRPGGKIMIVSSVTYTGFFFVGILTEMKEELSSTQFWSQT